MYLIFRPILKSCLECGNCGAEYYRDEKGRVTCRNLPYIERYATYILGLSFLATGPMVIAIKLLESKDKSTEWLLPIAALILIVLIGSVLLLAVRSLYTLYFRKYQIFHSWVYFPFRIIPLPHVPSCFISGYGDFLSILNVQVVKKMIGNHKQVLIFSRY